jgi:hypothetical protein
MTETNESDEFAGIDPAPAQRSPVLALVIIGLSLFTVFHLRHDIRYALSSGSAAPLEELQGVGMSYLDRYVRVHGVPDRRNSLYIEPRGGRERESFFRLLDASPPIFVRARDTADRADLSASWTGRLRHFGDVAYASSLRDYFGKAAEVDHYLDLSQVHAGILDPSAAIADRIGRKVVIGDKPLVVEGTPSEYALEMPREKYPKQSDAQHELERIVGKLGVAIHPLDASPDSFRFATPMLEKDPAKRAQLFAALGEAEIDILPEVPFYEAPRGSFHLTGHFEASDTLSVDKVGSKPAAQLPWSEVRSVSVREPLSVDENALVLTEGEAPGRFLWTPFVAALLLALAAFNVWYLTRSRRPAA